MLPKAESFNQELMGREIEIKIPLTDAEYDRLLSFVNGSDVRRLTHILKSDRYYSQYNTETERRAAVKAGKEPNVIRIRTEEDLQTHNKQTRHPLFFQNTRYSPYPQKTYSKPLRPE